VKFEKKFKKKSSHRKNWRTPREKIHKYSRDILPLGMIQIGEREKNLYVVEGCVLCWVRFFFPPLNKSIQYTVLT